jgi:hypothetical protein
MFKNICSSLMELVFKEMVIQRLFYTVESYRRQLQKNGKIYILRLNMTACGIPEGPALPGVFLF